MYFWGALREFKIETGTRCWENQEGGRKHAVMPNGLEDLNMPTLFLSAPYCKTRLGNAYRDFNIICSTGKALDFGMYSTLIARLSLGMKVVVFDRDRLLLAVGTLGNYTPNGRSHNVTWYDFDILGATLPPYTVPPRVNWYGVAVI